MPRGRALFTVGMMMSLAACGGEKALDAGDTTAMAADSLVPIADQPLLPDTTTPAPPETVYVDRPAPAPTKRPTTSRPAPVTERPAPPPATPPAPPPAAPALAVASGSAIQTTTLDSINSRTNKVGDVIRVRVSRDVLGSDGRTVIPAGSIVALGIVEIAAAPSKGGAPTLVLAARSVSINGADYPITARATDYEYELKGRGVTGREVGKTAAGAAAGAIIGRVIGGKSGTVVGAIGGAAAGAAVADQTQDRDIIVAAGKPMVITLRDEFSRSGE